MNVTADQIFPVSTKLVSPKVESNKTPRLARLPLANKLLFQIEKLPTSDTLQVLSTAGDGDERNLY